MKSHPTNILVVDDHPLLAEMLKIQLEKGGFKVRVAQNGKLAVQAIKELTPGLLITDLFMDEMDGIELLTYLKKNCPKLKIIAMSGQIDGTATSFLAMAKVLGAHRTLPKPFEFSSLLQLIGELLPETLDDGSKPAAD